MKKPGKSAITKQLEILNTIQGKGPVDWAVVLVLTSWPNVGEFLDYKRWETWDECKAVNNTLMWIDGYSDTSPVEYLGYAELPEPPIKYKRALYIAIAMIVTGIIGLLVTR